MSSIFFDALKKISQSALTEIVVSQERCIDLCWTKSNLCNVCQENCATDAIKIESGVEIDWGKCVKCGVCAAVCPTEVFEIQSPSNRTILNSIVESSENEHIIVECDFVNGRYRGEEKHPRSKSGKKITVPCIGRFSEIFLLHSIIIREGKIEYVKCTSDCRFTEGLSATKDTRRRTERLLEMLRPSTLKDKPKDSGSISERRRVLKETGLQAIDLLLPQSTQAAKPASLRGRTPPQRNDLLELVKNQTPPNITVDMEEMPFGTVQIDTEKCRLHGVCASACPTSALQLLDDNQGKELSLMHGLCVGCKVCVYACPEGALTLVRKIDSALITSPRKTITGMKYRLCTSCGRHFSAKTGSDSSTCPSCIKRWSVIEEYAEEAAES